LNNPTATTNKVSSTIVRWNLHRKLRRLRASVHSATSGTYR